MTTVRRFAPQAKIVFDTVDLHFVREERQARVKQDDSLESAIVSRKEQELNWRCGPTSRWSSARSRKRSSSRNVPESMSGFCRPSIRSKRTESRDSMVARNIVFIGGFQHPPNADAVLYFAKEIFPLVRERLPDAVSRSSAPIQPPEIRELESPNIHVLGHVPDVKPLFHHAAGLGRPRCVSARASKEKSIRAWRWAFPRS